MNAKHAVRVVVLISITWLWASRADAQPSLDTRTNFFVAMEISTESALFISRTQNVWNTTYAVNGTVADSGFTMNVTGTGAGQPLSLSFTGSLSGSVGTDLVDTFTGTGSYAGSPFSSSGQIVLPWDATANDYLEADYSDGQTFGDPISRSVRGVEEIGISIAGNFVGGWLGASAPNATATWISNIVDLIVPGIVPPPLDLPPAPLPRGPADPKEHQQVMPNLLSVGFFQGEKDDADQGFQNDEFNGNNGALAGTLTMMPEPSSFGLALLSMLGFVVVARRFRMRRTC